MGSRTTNLNFYKPDVGERGWGATVNQDNWDALDRMNTDVISATNYNVLNTGAETGSAISTLLDNVASAGGGTVRFRRGVYAYATAPNLARVGVNILCDRGAVFLHTGIGNALTIDAGAASSGIFRTAYDGLCVQGNSNSSNGLYVRGIHHSRFIHATVRGCATTGAGILVEWCVCNEWNTPSVSVNQGAFSSTPLIGMLLTRRGSGAEHTTTQSLLNPVIEGVGGDGIKFDYTANNTIYGGTSESNNRGLYLTQNAAQCEIHNLDMENNAAADVTIEGADHLFLGVLSTSFFHVNGSSGVRNHIMGGRYATIQVDSGSNNNTFSQLTYNITGTGAFTNNGTNTGKYRVFNLGTQTFDADIP